MLQHFLEVGVIGLALRHPLRSILSSRFVIAYPDLASKLRIGFGALALCMIAAWVRAPGLLLMGALLATMFIAAERWRARPAWGWKRGLPPGSLGIFPDTWSDERFYLREAAKHGPIFKTSNFLHPAVCVLGLDRGLELLRDHEADLETPTLPFAEFVPGGLLRYMHDPGHSYYRDIFRRALSPRVVEQFAPAFTRTVQGGLAEFSAASQADEFGLPPLPHVSRLMLDLWFPLFFGIDPESQQGSELRSLLRIIDIENPTRASPARIRSAVSAASGLLEQQCDGWHGSPPACLLGAIQAEHEAAARDRVVIGNLLYLLHTSSSDMSGLLCWLFKMMSGHPEWLESLAAAPGPPGLPEPGSLATRIVMETLRMRQSEFLYRSTIREFRFREFRIPKNWLVRICVWESHRDPGVFTEPDRFNPDRFLERTYSRAEYSPFGLGSHACIASQLATLVGSIFVRELAAGFRLLTPSAGGIELGSYRHWKPDSGFRIRLEARA